MKEPILAFFFFSSIVTKAIRPCAMDTKAQPKRFFRRLTKPDSPVQWMDKGRNVCRNFRTFFRADRYQSLLLMKPCEEETWGVDNCLKSIDDCTNSHSPKTMCAIFLCTHIFKG